MDASDAEKLTFKADAIRAHVADVSCALDPSSFASTVADRAALSSLLQLLDVQLLLHAILPVSCSRLLL